MPIASVGIPIRRCRHMPRQCAGPSDRVQHLSAVHQRILGLERVGEPVELLEPGIGIVLAVLGVTGNLHGDDVFGNVLARVGAECGTEYPGADEGASRQRGSSRSANGRSYSAACSARMWMTMTSSSLMTAAPLVALALILPAGPDPSQCVPDSTLPSTHTHEIRLMGPRQWSREPSQPHQPGAIMSTSITELIGSRGGGWLLGPLFNKKPASILHWPLRRI